MDIEAWLRDLSLGQYGEAFRENAIDADVLPSLTADDLKEMGVVSVGHRRKLLAAIAALSSPQAAAIVTASATADTAERRQLSVMFCDLVGSTALSAQLDPEDMRDIIGAYHRCCASAIERHGGFVAKYMGDGVLAYFGYPTAHEHDAERAVQAGLAVADAVPRLPTATSLQVRVGIATGIVVVGDLIGAGASRERGVIGDTPNLAARLQGIAAPGSVVIADGTRRLLGDLFELRDLGGQDLKGIAGPTQAWVALRANLSASRFEALHAGGLTALVGREEECELMLRRWTKAKAGSGQVLLLSGEAGIGKSRLTAAFLEQLAGEPHARLRYFCSPQYADSAFFPVIGQLERAAGFGAEDDARTKLDKLDAVLQQTATSPEDAALIAELLSLPNDGRYPRLELAAPQRRRKTMEALRTQTDTLARESTVLMIFEDVHWADPSSLESFSRLVDRIESVRVLLFMTFRPEFAPPWTGRPNVTALTVNRLPQGEAAALVDRVVGAETLAAEVKRDIIERADGVPLFVEEMTKAVLEAQGESAERTPASTPVPATLHASLMARLDRLGHAKAVAQIGAVIGREFSHDIVAAVFPGTAAELALALDRLVDAGLVFRQGSGALATYLFKHALVQDAAAGTLLREPRRSLHARIAEAIETLHPDIAENRPETLARHCDEAGLVEKAAALWGKAGQQSLARSALVEAERQISRALALIARLPGTPTLRREQIKLQVSLANTLIHTKGYTSASTKASLDEAAALIERADALGEPLDDPLAPFAILYVSFSVHFNSFDGAVLRDIATHFLALAEKQHSGPMLMMGHRLVGVSLLYTGEPEPALRSFDRAIALFEARQRPLLLKLFNVDVQTTVFAWRSLALWLLGFPDAAQADAQRAIDEARSADHAATLLLVLASATPTFCWCGDYATTKVNAKELMSLAQKLASGWEQVALAYEFVVSALTGKSGEAIQFVPILAGMQARGFTLLAPVHASLLARSHAELGQFDEAGHRIDEAFHALERTREGWFAADVHRMAGEIVLMSPEPDVAKARSFFDHALRIARAQNARSLELRAAMSMARLLRDRGRRDEARDLLAPVHACFTEGFETRDLKEAKALLEELVPSPA